MDLTQLRERLIKARQFIGCNRKQFAEELGIPYRTVTNYENGSREPGSEYISKVADACGCTTDWLLGLSDSPRETAAQSAKHDIRMQTLLNACAGLNDSAIEKLVAYAEELAFNPANKK